MVDLRAMLENAACRFPGKDAIIMGGRRLTYAALDADSGKIAGALAKLGVRKGDRVATLLSNSPECVVIYFGIIKAGAVMVPLDVRYKFEELVAILRGCQPLMLITESASLKPVLSVLPLFPSIRHVANIGSEYEDCFPSYRQMLEWDLPVPNVTLDLDDIATLAFTSGPTTSPHGAMISHRSLCNEAEISARGFEQTDRDVVMLYALPIHHMFGLTGVLLTSLNLGCTIVMVVGTGISIGTVMEAIEKHRGTMLCGVPYIFALLVKTVRREGIKNDLSSMRIFASGGAPLPVDTIKNFKRYFGRPLLDIYGITEAICHVTCPPVDGSGKIGSCGKPLPGWEIKIVDDDGSELPRNQEGEVWVKGLFMSGYYYDPIATDKVITGGWLHTGDFGKMDEDGYLYLTGLKKRMLILKGQNVYPVDIERVLVTHPKIASATVIPEPDKLRGQVVKAIVRLKEGQRMTKDEIKHFCLQRMADYKCPREIAFDRTRDLNGDGCQEETSPAPAGRPSSRQ